MIGLFSPRTRFPTYHQNPLSGRRFQYGWLHFGYKNLYPSFFQSRSLSLQYRRDLCDVGNLAISVLVLRKTVSAFPQP